MLKGAEVEVKKRELKVENSRVNQLLIQYFVSGQGMFVEGMNIWQVIVKDTDTQYLISWLSKKRGFMLNVREKSKDFELNILFFGKQLIA